MRYNIIRQSDISNGPGIRVSIFIQGCSHHCKGCFNPETWDFNSGKEFTDDTINTLIRLSDKPQIAGLSILGGEPLEKANYETIKRLTKTYSDYFNQEKTIWLWSGYKYDEIEDKSIFDNIDVLVDGEFIEKLADPTLAYRGSSNQVIHQFSKKGAHLDWDNLYK